MWNSILNWLARMWSFVWGEIALWFALYGGVLVLVVAIVVIGWLLSAFVTRTLKLVLRRSKLDKGMATFICSFTKVTLRIIVLVVAAGTIGINTTSILTALGAAGLTLGLAMRDSLSNLASGMMILFNQPFHAGDYIEAGGAFGTVESVDLMHTTLVTSDNKRIIYPNAKITSDILTNYTAEKYRRVDLNFPVEYGTSIDRVKAVMADVAEKNQFVKTSRDITIGISGFNCRAINFELRFWINADNYWSALYSMQEGVMIAFEKAGIRPSIMEAVEQ